MSNVVRLTDDEARLGWRLARHFALYGAPDSQLSNADTNLLGVLGEFAASKRLFGSIEPVVVHRRKSLDDAVLNGKVRDGGTDFDGYRINVKCTLDSYVLGARRLHLLVPPWQVDSETCYVHTVVVPPPSGELREVRGVTVHGWAPACLLQPAERGAFLGWPCCVGAECLPIGVLDLAEYEV